MRADNLEALVTGKNESETELVLAWLDQLSPLRFGDTQTDVYNRRQDGTGEELFLDKFVQTWLNQEGGQLFISGKPGVGKTIFSSIAFEHLQTTFDSQSEVGVAIVYCNYKEGNNQTLENVVIEITHQLACQASTIPPAVTKAYWKYRRNSTRLTFEKHKSLLQAMIDAFNKVYIIIDALDEFRDEEAAPDFIELIRGFPRHAALLVTSRDLPEITSEFSDWPKTSIVAIESDVRKFIEGAIRRSRQLKDAIAKDPSLREMVCTGVWEKCCGMFLLARLHTEALTRLHIEGLSIDEIHDEIEKALKSLPQEPSKAYEKSMEILDLQKPSERDRAFQVLMWVWGSSRPLLIAELQHALALRSGQTICRDHYLPSADRIASVCAGLINIDSESNVVGLVHETLQAFFDSNHERLFPDAHRRITLTCLRYLILDDFATGACDSPEDLRVRTQTCSLLGYAANYWGVYAIKSLESAVLDEVLIFLQQRHRLAAAVQAQYSTLSHSCWYDDYPRPIYPIWVAASFGLEETTRRLLHSNRPIVIEPLYMAFAFAQMNNHIESAQLLFEEVFQAGKVAESHDFEDLWSWPSCYSSLHMAVEKGHQRVVRRLLEDGVDPRGYHRKSRGGWLHRYVISPLYLALARDHHAISKVLVQAGAHLLKNHAHRTIIHEIVNHGDAKSLRLLCRIMSAVSAEHGLVLGAVPELETKDDAGFTALHIATFHHRSDLLRMLILMGAEVKTQTSFYSQNALHLAALIGHQGLCSLLIDEEWTFDLLELSPIKLASIPGQERFGISLILASPGGRGYNGDIDVRSFILSALHSQKLEEWVKRWNDRRINISLPDHQGDTPLMLAIRGGHRKVLELLIAKKAFIHSCDAKGQTPIMLAASLGKAGFVEALQKVGADVHFRTSFGATLLHMASAGGHDDVVRIALGLNIDADAVDYDGFTPLHYAAEYGHVRVLRRLLAAGAKVNSKTDHSELNISKPHRPSGSGLYYIYLPADEYYENWTQDRDNPGITPLHLAVGNGHATAAKVLLDAGADVEARLRPGTRPLSLAAALGHTEVLNLLLQCGADVKAVDYERKSATRMAIISKMEEQAFLLMRADGFESDAFNVAWLLLQDELEWKTSYDCNWLSAILEQDWLRSRPILESTVVKVLEYARSKATTS